MSLPKILVTGATGKTGAVVASELLRAGYPVRAMVRAPAMHEAQSCERLARRPRWPIRATPSASQSLLENSDDRDQHGAPAL
jgi:nucleoside-diphosphate-sugar epimerase